jgi:actin-like ATPase involved in cell morphogenesis
MTEKKTTTKKEIVDITKPEEHSLLGVDCGTMNLVLAKKEGDTIEITNVRNMYLPIDKNQLTMAQLSNIDYVESEDNVYIIGEDAYKFGNMFNQEVCRPMSKGLISPNEVDGIDVLTLIIDQLVGKTYDGHVVYSVPSPSIDIVNNITYHEGVFKRIFGELGYTSEPFNEAMAIIYSQCQDTQYTGLAFSFGAGMLNISLCFKSIPIVSFSIARSGDWIDENAAMSLGTVANRVTSIKEKGTDLSNFKIGNKKERRVREAIIYYYKEVIRYGLDMVVKKLDDVAGDLELPDSIPIIVSGGTSLAKGFIPVFTEVLEEYTEFPISVDGIKHADDPLSCVAEGLLIKGMMEQKSSELKNQME